MDGTFPLRSAFDDVPTSSNSHKGSTSAIPAATQCPTAKNSCDVAVAPVHGAGEVDRCNILHVPTLRFHLSTYDTDPDDVDSDDGHGLSEALNSFIDGATEDGADYDEDDAETDEGSPREFIIYEDLDGNTLVEDDGFDFQDDVSDSGSNKENIPPGSAKFSQLQCSDPADSDGDETYHGDRERSCKSFRHRVRSVAARQPFERQVMGRSRVLCPVRERKRVLGAHTLRQLELNAPADSCAPQ